MCTVTVVPHELGVRVMCNRDEQRTRPTAAPPRLRYLGSRLAAFPVDPLGGGTWIGVNDAGLAAALLNRAATARASAGGAPRSRGHIVRHLLGYGTIDEALDAVASIDAADFRPFRVVVVQSGAVGIATSDGTAISRERRPLHQPLLLTSSSLGDALVEAPRGQLFTRLVAARRTGWLDGQARFHRHQWTSRPEISVRMERADAMTVSRTIVDISSRSGGLLYEAPVSGQSGRSPRAWCSLR